MTYFVLETDRTPDELAACDGSRAELDTRTVSVGTAEAAVVKLLEKVELEWLAQLKLTIVGRVQRRRAAAERPPQYQDHQN